MVIPAIPSQEGILRLLLDKSHSCVFLLSLRRDDLDRHLSASLVQQAFRCAPDMSPRPLAIFSRCSLGNLIAYGDRRISAPGATQAPIRPIERCTSSILLLSSQGGGGWKDKALTTIPSRLRDMPGHRRKAFLPTPLVKVISSRRSFSCSNK